MDDHLKLINLDNQGNMNYLSCHRQAHTHILNSVATVRVGENVEHEELLYLTRGRMKLDSCCGKEVREA